MFSMQVQCQREFSPSVVHRCPLKSSRTIGNRTSPRSFLVGPRDKTEVETCVDNFIQITAFCRPKPGVNAFVHGRKATVYAWKTNDLLKRTFNMKLTTKEKKKENVPYIFVNNMGIA